MIKCPICYGRGRVQAGFYTNDSSTINASEPVCRTCNGTGIVMEYSQSTPCANCLDLQAEIAELKAEVEELKEEKIQLKDYFVGQRNYLEKQVDKLKADNDRILKKNKLLMIDNDNWSEDVARKNDEIAEPVKSCGNCGRYSTPGYCSYTFGSSGCRWQPKEPAEEIVDECKHQWVLIPTPELWLKGVDFIQCELCGIRCPKDDHIIKPAEQFSSEDSRSSEEAFEKWYEKNGSNVLNTSWCRDLVAWKVKAALHIVFKAGQEDRDKDILILQTKIALLQAPAVCKTLEEYVEKVEEWNAKYLQEIEELKRRLNKYE